MSGRSYFERLSEDPRVLNKAWEEVNRNARSLSFGVDFIRLEQFSAHAQRNLTKLRLRLKNGEFKFSDLRGSALPKPDGNHRPLQVATINDRVVQKAIEQLIRKALNDKYNLFNNPVSYAYISTEDIEGYDSENPQTFKGVRGALEKVRSYAEEGFGWTLKADIIDFFPSVDTEKLLNAYIFPALTPDESLNQLIRDAFEQEVKLTDEVRKLFNDAQIEQMLTHSGLPQGSILSPLFSNVYLSSFDKRISDAGLVMIRYVDDFVVMAKTRKEAEAAYRLVSKELNGLGLKIHKIGHEKTSIQESNELVFLGIRYKNGSFYPSDKALKRNIEKLEQYPKYKTLTKNLQSLQMLVQAWAATYHFCSDDKELYKSLNASLEESVARTLYKARLRPVNKLGSRDLRRLGIQKFNNAVVTFNQKKGHK